MEMNGIVSLLFFFGFVSRLVAAGPIVVDLDDNVQETEDVKLLSMVITAAKLIIQAGNIIWNILTWLF